jgi:hypothetical protein
MKKLFQSANPQAMFILGLLTLPAFLFQEKLLFRLPEAALFLLLALYTGNRIRPLPALLLLASVTAAALLAPYGRVLTQFFGLPITEGALKLGVSRAILLLGLLYLSKLSVVRGMAFPGRIGYGVGKVFYYFERFSACRQRISIKNLPGSLDSLLLSVSAPECDGAASPTALVERRLPLIIPLAASLSCWVLLLF